MSKGSKSLWIVGMTAALMAAAVLGPESAPRARADEAKTSVSLQTMDGRFKRDIQPFLEAHCYKCHGNGKHKGDVVLDSFNDFGSVLKDRKTWESVHDVLEKHEMPPKKEKQPAGQELDALAKFANDALNFGSAGPRDPGFVAIHRLNRNEYNNTIRDLVGVNFEPASDFPADDTGYGFDNIADVLSMSPLLAEK